MWMTRACWRKCIFMKAISTCSKSCPLSLKHVDCLRAWLLDFCATEKRNSVRAHHRVTKKASTAFFDGKRTLVVSFKKFSRPEMQRDSFFCDFMLAIAERKRTASHSFVPTLQFDEFCKGSIRTCLQQIDFVENNELLKPLHLEARNIVAMMMAMRNARRMKYS